MTRFRAFVDVAGDPALIPGIHEACDLWCKYCPATRRCLAFQCSVAAPSNTDSRGLAGWIGEALGCLVGLGPSTSRGKGPPRDPVAKEVEHPVRGCEASPIVDVDDPIDRMGRRYGRTVEAYLSTHADLSRDSQPDASGPTAFEVLAWFRELVPAKIYRALASASLAGRGNKSREQDAIVSAKVALIGIDRSLEAIARVTAEAPDQQLELLQAQLRWLRRELETRFPVARSFVRMGLDGGTAPVIQRPDRTGGGST
jgi:hypothetical protein